MTTERKSKSYKRRFHADWEEEPLVAEDIVPVSELRSGTSDSSSHGAVCVLCGEQISQCRKFVIERHLKRRHPRAVKYKLEKKRRLVHRFKAEREMQLKQMGSEEVQHWTD